MKQTAYFKFLSLFGMLLVTTKLCSMLFAQRVFEVYGIIFPGGILPFCITFMLLDIITNNYGLKNARKIIIFNLFCEAVMTLITLLSLEITPSRLFQHEYEFQEVMTPFLKLFVASISATLIAYLLNCYIFSKLYYSFKGKLLWLRCILATAVGELVFSVIWTTIFFWKQLNINTINTLVIDQYLFKIIFEIVSLPITYIIVQLLDKYEINAEIEWENFKPIHHGR
ncbi:MAG: queuosine precursor transporter [Burkholderiales bacterium]|nr:queuosine precursor transporter [Burkholderiales bacterium]